MSADAPTDLPNVTRMVGPAVVPPARHFRRLCAGLRWCRRGVALLAVGACAIGIVLRCGPRDRWSVLEVVYYATPLPVVAGAALIGAAWLWRRRRRRLAAFALATAVSCAVWCVAGSYYRNAAEPASGRSLRVVLWNVARGTFGWSELARELTAFDADVLCLVESRRLQERDTELRQRLPGYTIEYCPRGLTLLSRVGLRDVRFLPLPRGGAVRATIGGETPLDLVLADVPSNPFGARGPTLAKLRAEAPAIMLGDFNTPRTSVHFDPLRADYAHAFEVAGRGMVETWPWPLPVLDLDHVWCRRSLRVVACRYERRWCSDHCAVVVDLLRR